ncbi:hypothetical protein SmJEL517_g05619 [Synchytrium microbalum]|uniref:Uncharacterized protein n=1 Tax=Synchytrium microbalum TaxID=1806994 RepID=A0A507BUG3_9FUNG|nr:uncharacterized protein SmJEL517_g05619 [Synchytrium microbalum]TPX30928.1 hypothetical protein SmJEL517_g05619 [Synchytrium microbalum]
MGCAVSVESLEAAKRDKEINDIIERSKGKFTFPAFEKRSLKNLKYANYDTFYYLSHKPYFSEIMTTTIIATYCIPKEQKKREAKVLLLGAGEAGKTTVLKQMRLLHTRNGEPTFGDTERKQLKRVIADNMIANMLNICDAMEKLSIEYGSEECKPHRTTLAESVQKGEGLTPTIVQVIKSLWKDTGVQICYSRSNEYQLHDSAKYFFDALDRVSPTSFIPTDQDVLQCRIKTTGIQELVFEEENLTLKVIDVGGQRSERRKWVSCFEGVTATIFLAAVSEYDQVLQEDETRVDLLEAKYNDKGNDSIAVYWPDYKGTTIEAAMTYFKTKFVEVNRNENKMVSVDRG